MLLELALIGVLAQAVSPHAASAPPEATGVIRGQVTDQETGQPIARAAVMLNLSARNVTRENLAGPDGRFEFRDVPPGSFQLSATAGERRATHVRGFYRAAGTSGPWLKPGEVLERVSLSLVRARAVAGRVVDERGQPLAGVELRVQPAGAEGGSGIADTRTSDDRGMFRIFGIAPGRYVICARIWGAQQFGLAAVKRIARYVSTCYPSALSAGDAQVVTVAAEDIEGIEIRVRRSLTYVVSGTVHDSNGQQTASGLVGLTQQQDEGSLSSAVEVRDGRFVFRGVVPGRYVVSARVGGPDRLSDGRDAERGQISVEVSADDIEGLTVVTRKASTVTGRVRFEGGDPPPPSPDRAQMGVAVRVDANAQHAATWSPVPPALVREDLTFELSGLFGPQWLALMNPPRGWVVKSIIYDGKDVPDAPINLQPGRNDVDIVLSDRGAIVSGLVTDDRGAPATSATVLVFPADASRWHEDQLFEGRAAPTKQGRFTFGPVRAGEYFIVAIPAAQMPNVRAPRELLERLVKIADRITLLEADRRTVDVRVMPLPEDRRQ